MQKTQSKPSSKNKIIIQEELELHIQASPKKLFKKLYTHRRVLGFKGLFMILFGVISLAFPGLAIVVLLRYLAVIMIVVGAALMISAMGHLNHNKHRKIWLIEGTADIAIGVMIVINPQITIQLMLWMVATWSLIKAVAYIVHLWKIKTHHRIFLINAILLLAFSAILVLCPFDSAVVLVYVIGGFGIAFGLSVITLAFQLKKLVHDGEKITTHKKTKI